MFGCNFKTRRHENYEEHRELVHYCETCKNYIARMDLHFCEQQQQHGGNVSDDRMTDDSFFREQSRSHQGTIRTYMHFYEDEQLKKVTAAFDRAKSHVEKLLTQHYAEHQSMLATFGLQVIMERDETEDDGSIVVREESFYFHSSNAEIFAEEQFEEAIMSAASEVNENVNEFIRNGSGWRVKFIESMQIRLAELRLFQPARAKGFLPMPFKGKSGFINFRNKDNDCFKYVICAGVYLNEMILDNASRPRFHKRNVSNHFNWKGYFSKFDWKPVRDGVDLYGNLAEFEEINSLRIHVFSHRDDNIVLIRKSKADYKTVLNLFLIHEKGDEEGVQNTHFVLITNMSRFFGHLNLRKRHFCKFCLRIFASIDSVLDHEVGCKENPVQVYKFPKPGKVLKFERHDITIPFPYIIYYDWENLSIPKNEQRGNNTVMHTEYQPASFSIAVVHNSGQSVSLEECEFHEGGANIVGKFFERMFFHARRLLTHIKATNNSVKPTKDELELYKKAEHCMFCKEKFTEGYGISHSVGHEEDEEEELLDEENLDQLYEGVDEYNNVPDHDDLMVEGQGKKVKKVFNHNHISGRMIGATCARCNMAQRSYHTIPAIAFNASRWDLHILVKGLENSLFKAENIKVIARTSEEFVEMIIEGEEPLPDCGTSKIGNPSKATCGNRKPKIRFIDCANFLKGNLANLAENLRKENVPALDLVSQSFPFLFGRHGIVQKYRPGSEYCHVPASEENVSLLLSKLPFAYKYLDSAAKLNPNVPMPDRASYDNELKQETCSDEQWEKIRLISERFKISNFVQWVGMYNVIDVILLAVVWETFRNKTFERFQVDPSAVCTVSGLAWNCFLKTSNIQLEYLRDFEMVQMLEQLRGGISGCATKIVKANHPNCKDYDPAKPARYIGAFDINSLYAHAMCQPLPCGGWQWVDPAVLAEVDWTDDNIGEKLGHGYIMEVDLEYPIEAQLATIDLPLAPEKKIVRYEMLSARQQRILTSLGNTGKSFLTQPKLCLTHFDKNAYVIHYKELGQYVKQGLKLKSIRRAIQFDESPYMRDFVSFNLEHRKTAPTLSERDFDKIFSNGCYGRTLLSAKNKIEVGFCTSRTQALKKLADSRLKDFKALSPNLSMMIFRPKTQTFQNPIGTGFSILGLSKRIFYEAYYQLVSIFGPTLRLGQFDTDGCIVYYDETYPGSFYDVLFKNEKDFDLSKLPADHEFFQRYSHVPDLRIRNKDKAGIMKIESTGIHSLCCGKSKCYSLMYCSGVQDSRLKGINASSKRQIDHDAFINCMLQENVKVYVEVNQLRSRNHELMGVKVKKLGLHSLDIARVFPSDDINFCLPFGCHLLKHYMNYDDETAVKFVNDGRKRRKIDE